MAVKAPALIFIMFSLNILFTASSSLHRSSSSVQEQNGSKARMVNSRKHTVHELVQSIKFAAGHGGAAHGGGGVAHGSSGAHGSASSHGGEGGGRGVGEGNGESSTPGTANVIPIYGAAGGRRRENQAHKGGAHSRTCNLSMLTVAIFLSLYF